MKGKDLMDRQQRRINYLRLSVTDRCNLRCRYCMPPEGRKWLPHSEILRHEEMLRIVRIFMNRGVRKVRITGGEPLVRKNLACLVRELKKLTGIEEITMTTNGVLLAEHAEALKRAGVDRVNISLDTMRPEVFSLITGKDCLDSVLAGIDAARRAGMTPVKINAVPMAGINDGEIEDLAALSFEEDIHVRFIEQMPVGMRCAGDSGYLSMDRVRSRIESRWGALVNVLPGPLDGPAGRYRIQGAGGEIGFIHAMTRHFCGRCNRMRLTSDGKLRPCLLDDTVVDVKRPLRSGAGDDVLEHLIEEAVMKKKAAHAPVPLVNTQMVSIGG